MMNRIRTIGADIRARCLRSCSAWRVRSLGVGPSPGRFAVGCSVCLFVLIFCGCHPESATSRRGGSPKRDSASTIKAQAAASRLREVVEACGGTLTDDDRGHPIVVDLVAGRVSAEPAVWDALSSCPDLKVLRARWSQVDVRPFEIIGKLKMLEELALQDAGITDDDLIQLVSRLPRLRRLSLRNTPQVTDYAIVEIAAFSELTQISLIELQLDGQCLSSLASMRSLKLLDLRRCHGINGAAWSQLAAAPQLAELRIGGAGVDNRVLEAVARLPQLRRLTIEDANVDGLGISHLAANPATARRLESLAVSRCSALGDEQLKSLQAFRNLRQLVIRDLPITGAFLQDVRPLDRLEQLTLNQTYLVDEAFAWIADFSQLKRLELAHNFLTLSAIEHIRGLSRLEHLDLTDCGLQNEFLEPLTHLAQLKTLIVAGNPDVDREVVARVLGPLEGGLSD